MTSYQAWSRRSLAAAVLIFGSGTAWAVFDETPPSIPPNFTATAVSGTQINLAWGTSTDNRGVTGYNLWRCGGGGSCTGIYTAFPNEHSFQDTGRTPGTTYTYQITAFDAAGNQSDVATATATTPDTIAPSQTTGLTAVAASSGTQIDLSWTAATDNVAVTGYAIEYCAGAGCSPVNALTTTGGTTYSVTGLSQATSYSFRVRAYDAASNYGGYSNNASATTPDVSPPSAPGSMGASASSGTQIDLSWSAATDNVGVTGYAIERCMGAGCSNFSFLANAGSTSYSDSPLTPATSYSYRVRAYDAKPNYGGYSPTASAVTPDTVAPSVPTSFSAAAASGTAVNLNWAASSDNVGVSGYSIERCAGVGCGNFSFLANTASTSFTDSPLTPATSYSYRLQAYDAKPNYSGYSSTASAATPDSLPPSAPTGLGATAASTSGINLSWTAATDNVGVSLYQIQRCQGSGCANFAPVTTTAATSFSDSGLADNTVYNYVVRAQDAALNWGGVSNTATATTFDGTPPSQPAGLTVSPVTGSGTSLNLNWTASTDNVGVTGYAVDRCQGTCTPTVEIAQPATNSFSDTGLSNGGTYSYRVRARDARGNWSTNSTVVTGIANDTQLPTAPSGLAVTVGNSTQLNLTWTAATDNIGVTLYSIERCTGASCTTFTQVGTSTSASFNSTGLAPATTYRFQVRARDAALNWSATYSNVAAGTTPSDGQAPTAPTGLTVGTRTVNTVALSWTASTDNVGVTSYIVQRCTGASCTVFTNVGATGATSYTDSALTPATTYKYQVKAQDAALNVSGASNVVTAATLADTTAPSAPTITVTGTTVVTASLSFSATDNVGVTGYQLDRCTGASCTTYSQIATPTSSTYTDTGLAPNTTYRYRARARDAAGNTSSTGAVVNATTPVDNTAPSTPGNFRSTGKTDTTVALAWDAATDNVGVTSYRIQRCTGASCTSWAEVGSTTTATTYTSSPLTQLTTYRFRVGARDGAGLTTYTSPIQVTTNDGQAPTTPTNLTTLVEINKITLGWIASTDNVGVTAYLVERCVTSNCTFVQIASVGTTSYVDTSVASSTNYTYRVAARDAQGNISGYVTSGQIQSASCD